MKLSEARKYRKVIESGGDGLNDREISEIPGAARGLKGDGSLIGAGTRIGWEGKVMRARTALWDRAENWPDRAPELWEEIGYRQGVRVIPESIEAENAFSKGERGWWGETLYESVIDANVWTPAAWPEGWKLIES